MPKKDRDIVIRYCEYCKKEIPTRHKDGHNVILSQYNKSRWCSNYCRTKVKDIPQKFCIVCNKEIKKGRMSSVVFEKSKYCSTKCLGIDRQESMKGENNPNYNKIRKKCIDCNKEFKNQSTDSMRCRDCMGKSQVGNNNPNWRDGKSSVSVLERSSKQNKEWRESVFERDDYTCQICGDNKGGNLNAHHIKEWAKYPELRFDINNGITLCKNCHIDIHRKK